MRNLLVPATILNVSGFIGCFMATQCTSGSSHALLWIATIGYFGGSAFCFYRLSKRSA